jgi:hypothetical protein
MTPYQSARSKQLHTFFHHARQVKHAINAISRKYPDNYENPCPPLDQQNAKGYGGIWQGSTTEAQAQGNGFPSASRGYFQISQSPLCRMALRVR